MLTSGINLAVFTWLFIRSPQHRWPVALMASAAIWMLISFVQKIPAMVDQLDNLSLSSLPFLCYAIALFGFRILDPVDLAFKTAVDQLSAGILVLDLCGVVVNVNLLAEEMLCLPHGQAKGRLFQEVFPAYNGDRPLVEFTMPGPRSASLPAPTQPRKVSAQTQALTGEPPGLRDFTLSSSRLKDWRGMEVGSLLLLRDVTGPKRAREREKEQHLAMAVMDERERMARELHDSLGQVLSYANFQVESAAQLSQEGQGEAAAAQLKRLGSVIRDAHADLREYILNLHSTASLEQPFFPIVKQYLDGFTRSYNIQTLLEVDTSLEQREFPPNTKLQLFRILQEAASNARKHGRAHQLRVSFGVERERIIMAVQDDGCGFRLEEVDQTSGTHYGLQFMRERAQAIGASLRVSSSPGAGTRVELDLDLIK